MDIDLSTIENNSVYEIQYEKNDIADDIISNLPQNEIVEELARKGAKPRGRAPKTASNAVIKSAIKETRQELSDDEKQQKLELITIMKLYIYKFKDDLKEYNKMKFEKMTLEELTNLRNQFDVILGANTSIANKQRMFSTAIFFVEKTVTSLNLLDCEGLSAVLNNNPDFQKDLQRLSLKYLSATDSKPEVSVPLTIVQTMLALDQINSSKKKLTNNSKNEIYDLNNEYVDL